MYFVNKQGRNVHRYAVRGRRERERERERQRDREREREREREQPTTKPLFDSARVWPLEMSFGP